MALGTYSELQSTVLTVMDREGDAVLTAYLPVAIALTEAKLNRKLRVADMETTVTGASSNGLLTLPDDFAAARRVEAYPYGPLAPVTPDYAAAQYPSGGGGIPRYYTIQGSTLTTYPYYTGDVTLDYYAKIPALSNTSPTNWLLSSHPDLYFFWVLCEAYAFIKDAETALVWNQRGAVTADEINAADQAKRYSNVSVRVKGPTP